MDFNIPNWVAPAITGLVLPSIFYVARLAKQVREAGFANKEDVEAIKKSILAAVADERKEREAYQAQATAARQETDKKLSAIEHDLEHVPGGDDIRTLSERLVKVEAALEQLPTKEALHGLGLKLERLAGAMEGHNAMQAEILGIVRNHQTILATAAARGP